MEHLKTGAQLFEVIMHPCKGHWWAIRSVVVCHAQAAHAFGAGIKCRHCTLCYTYLQIGEGTNWDLFSILQP